ncbi:hypothetical protein AYO47_09675 [Planctomyces sp. SCGC AG-212-M04]|nr:hypothetical protein AYO47_09675 [Planctomyces sp. SCGC AG-212-M04]
MKRSDIIATLAAGAVTLLNCCLAPAQEQAAAQPTLRGQQFHLRSQERMGLLIPLYVYPAKPETNVAWNKVAEMKRKYPEIPMWVIVNPASGPGQRVDPNYTRAIDRLHGAGCVTLGYVSTNYAKRSAEDVQKDVSKWRELYPKVLGIFFDEMVNADKAEPAAYQTQLSAAAHAAGYWPTVGNPGTDTPPRYFESEAADVIVIHEGDSWPSSSRLRGDSSGGDAGSPPFTRGLLLHSQKTLDAQKVKEASQSVRWIYVTEAPFRVSDPQAASPWDRVSEHLEATCRAILSNDR